jgi:hypothetical protein
MGMIHSGRISRSMSAGLALGAVDGFMCRFNQI